MLGRPFFCFDVFWPQFLFYFIHSVLFLHRRRIYVCRVGGSFYTWILICKLQRGFLHSTEEDITLGGFLSATKGLPTPQNRTFCKP